MFRRVINNQDNPKEEEKQYEKLYYYERSECLIITFKLIKELKENGERFF